MLSEEYTEIVGDIFIGGEWQTHDLQPKIVALEEQLKIEKQKHLDTSNWALEQQERGDTLETKLKDAEADKASLIKKVVSLEEDLYFTIHPEEHDELPPKAIEEAVKEEFDTNQVESGDEAAHRFAKLLVASEKREAGLRSGTTQAMHFMMEWANITTVDKHAEVLLMLIDDLREALKEPAEAGK